MILLQGYVKSDPTERAPLAAAENKASSTVQVAAEEVTAKVEKETLLDLNSAQ